MFGCGARRWLPGPAALFLGALLAALWLRAASTADAQPATQCSATIAGQDARRFSSWRDALDLDVDDTVALTWQVRGDAPTTRVTIEMFDRTWGAFTSTNRPAGGRWTGTVRVSDHARYGVGLYRLIISAGDCSLSIWVNVTGRAALRTPAGAGAAAVLISGLVLQGLGIAAAVRGGSGLKRAMLGGIPTGLGISVLAQQLGWWPLTIESVTTWLIPPVAIGGVAERGAFLLFRRRREAPPERLGPEAGAAPSAALPPPHGSIGRGEARAAEPPAPLPATPPSAPAYAPPPPTSAPLPESYATPSGVQDRPAMANGASRRPPGQRAIAPAAPVPDPPRTAFAMLYCPDAVVAEAEFELVVGLAPQAVPGVAGTGIVRPEWSVGPYTLTVQVIAEGFRLKEGDTWRQTVPVTAEHPYPQRVLYLTPEAQPVPVRARTIQAIYSIDSQTVGLAVRSVAVVRSPDLLGQAAPVPQPAGVDVGVPSSRVAADLTVRILHGESESDGRLLWTLETPHAGIDLPDAPLACDIGNNPSLFARQLVDRVNAREGQPGLYLHLKGVGRTIADQVPVQFWDVLKAVAAATPGRPPMILLLSEEAYIPWELAVLDDNDLIDQIAPPFLAAQANIGRWVLGSRRPKLPPPVEVQVRAMAVVAGEYNRPGWRRLVEAEQEAQALSSTYGAVAVNAATEDVLRCIGGSPPAELLHFAVHGIYDPTGVQEGLVLVDGRTLDPFEIRGASLARAPFVFLNACQVGSGNQILGDYAGIAEAFLYAGASGVVAPIWSIKDADARAIALRFYERVFGGASPAEVFRVERGAFRDAATSGTCLAYQFYGHPALKLRPGSVGAGGPGT